MKNRTLQSILAAGLLLLGSGVVGEDVPTPYLAQCVAQFEEDTDLAVELCRAKRARAVLAPGTSDCATSWRLISGRASCHKSDSASAATWDDIGFSPYSPPVQLSGPVALGTLVDFYGGRRAGDGGRFEVTAQDDGSLAVVDGQADAASNDRCVFQSGIHDCRVQGTYTTVNAYRYEKERSDYVYRLQLDGLLVEKEAYRKYCSRTSCFSGGCICASYEYPPPVTTRSLYLWQ